MCQDTWDERDDYDDQDEDRYDEYKDNLAMGRIWPDGSYREPDFDGPDPWVYRLSPRERFRRALRTLLPRRHVVIRREQYDDEPPY